MNINSSKTKELVVYFGKTDLDLPPLLINDSELERVHKAKLLGVMLSEDLTWNEHVKYLSAKASKRLYPLKLLQRAGVKQEYLFN